nr:hypothetical protein [Micromonospora citrea]
MLGQARQQIELGPRQDDGLTAEGDAASGDVDAEAAHHGGRRGRCGRHAAQQGADAGVDHVRPTGLGQVPVGSGAQHPHDLVVVTPCGVHQHGPTRTDAQQAQQKESVDGRDEGIHQYDVRTLVRVAGQVGQRSSGLVHREVRDDVTEPGQPVAEPPPVTGVVVDQQDARHSYRPVSHR